MNVVVLEDAAEDLESSAQFYQSCAIGVGDYFLDAILSDPDSLVLFAGIHPIYFGFHRMLSKRFPFGIYYEVENDVAYVYAILDLAARSALDSDTFAKEIDGRYIVKEYRTHDFLDAKLKHSAFQSIPSWNRIVCWLKEMETHNPFSLLSFRR